MNKSQKIIIPTPLADEDECYFLTKMAQRNLNIDRHTALLNCGWRHIGDRTRYGFMGRLRTRYYANLNFDNPCETFTQTEAWFINLYMLAFSHGVLNRLSYDPGFWERWRGVPWYHRVAANHFRVVS